MFFVDRMVFTAFFLPVVFVGREEGVGLGRGVVDLGKAETVCQRQGLTIDIGSADDVDVFIGGAVGEGLVEGGVDVAVGEKGGWIICVLAVVLASLR